MLKHTHNALTQNVHHAESHLLPFLILVDANINLRVLIQNEIRNRLPIIVSTNSLVIALHKVQQLFAQIVMVKDGLGLTSC